jgi:hypothetical protein
MNLKWEAMTVTQECLAIGLLFLRFCKATIKTHEFLVYGRIEINRFIAIIIHKLLNAFKVGTNVAIHELSKSKAMHCCGGKK